MCKPCTTHTFYIYICTNNLRLDSSKVNNLQKTEQLLKLQVKTQISHLHLIEVVYLRGNV